MMLLDYMQYVKHYSTKLFYNNVQVNPSPYCEGVEIYSDENEYLGTALYWECNTPETLTKFLKDIIYQRKGNLML